MIDIKDMMKRSNIRSLSYESTYSSKGIFGVNSKDESICKESLFSACSISKLLTTIAILQAKDEKIVDLKDDVNKYLLDWKLDGPLVKIEDLLINQSGISDVEGSYGTINKIIGKADLIKLLNGQTDYIKEKVTVKEEPRKEFIYSDNNTLILEKLLEDIYKKDYRSIIKDKILKPLGMTKSIYMDIEDLEVLNYAHGADKDGKYITKEKNIYPYDSVAGFWSTSEELYILMEELFRSYNNKSNKLLTHETSREMMIGHGCVDFTGYGVFVYEIRGKKVFHSQGWGEGFQSYMLGFLDDSDGIVVMMNQNPGVEQMDGPIGEIVKAYIDEKFNE